MRGQVFSYRHEVGADGKGRTIKSTAAQDGAKWGYQFTYRDPATGKRKTISGAGFANKRAAAGALAEALAAFEQSGRRAPTEPSRIALSTFIADEWLPAVRRQSKATTIENYEQLHRAYVEPHLGALPLRDVTSGRLLGLYELLEQRGGRRGQPLSPTTVHHVHVLLCNVFRFAVEGGHLRTSPTQTIPRRARPAQPTTSADDLRHWTPEQAARFLVATADDRLHALYVVALNVGLRRGELAGLQWRDLDLTSRVATLSVRRQRVTVGRDVLEATPKTKRSERTVEIDDATVRVLAAHRKRQLEDRLAWGEAWAGEDWVFPAEDGQPLHPQAIYRAVESATTRAALPQIGPHGLRHTCAVLLLSAGVPLKVVSERLGHSSTSFTADLYQHVIPGMQHAASSALSQILGLA